MSTVQRVIMYTIFNNSQQLQAWIHPQYRKKMDGFAAKILKRIQTTGSVLIKKLRTDPYSIYYFSQDEFLFMLVSTGPERDLRMKNYLKVVADIFYEIYDQRKFPMVLNCLMTEINRLEANEGSQDELERLTSHNIHSHKQMFSSLIRQRSQRSRTCKIASILIAAICLLLVYFLIHKLG